jgi:hypothetical protein
LQPGADVEELLLHALLIRNELFERSQASLMAVQDVPMAAQGTLVQELGAFQNGQAVKRGIVHGGS